mgnify:CR=1 FL=1
MVQVYASSVIDASADNVWSRIRAFNGLPQWHPAIADSRIENGQPADRVGCIRHFHLRDGGMIREKLLALSDYDYSCSYEILESPMGVTNYVATLKELTELGFTPTSLTPFWWDDDGRIVEADCLLIR